MTTSRATAEPAVDVTIVMPVHNTPMMYLREAVFSAVGQQTDYSIELMIWDDASGARGVRTLNRVVREARVRAPHVRVTVGRSESNNGPGESRNLAVKATRSEFLLWLDSDDVLAIDAVQRLVDVARGFEGGDHNPSMVISECVVLDVDGNVQGPTRSPKDYLTLCTAHAGSIDDPLAQVIFALQAQLLTRASFEAAGGFASDFALAEMTEFFQRWVRHNGARSISTIDYPAYFYRRRADSYSTVNRSRFVQFRDRALIRHIQETGVKAELLSILGRSDQTGAQHYSLWVDDGPYSPVWSPRFAPYTDPQGIKVGEPHDTGEFRPIPG